MDAAEGADMVDVVDVIRKIGMTTTTMVVVTVKDVDMNVDMEGVWVDMEVSTLATIRGRDKLIVSSRIVPLTEIQALQLLWEHRAFRII